MKVKINGEYRDVAAQTVLQLLEELRLEPSLTVVEKNEAIVDRALYPQTELAEGDVLELVRLVGGG